LGGWGKNKNPFSFTTEASINLSDDNELMGMMVRAGFVRIFIGIESPNTESLDECNKVQNKTVTLLLPSKESRTRGWK